MCEYSLAYFPNRLAIEGDQLVVRRFPCGTIGLVAAQLSWKQWLFPSTTCAVCVPPGARLVLMDLPKDLRQRFGVGPVEEVTFTQQNAEAFTYRDAVRFREGREVLLQKLPAGLRVRVLRIDLDSAEPSHTPIETGRTFAGGGV